MIPKALPGIWREIGGLSGLVRLDVTALTPGMVVVAKKCEPWEQRPELRWQAWPDQLEIETFPADEEQFRVRNCDNDE